MSRERRADPPGTLFATSLSRTYTKRYKKFEKKRKRNKEQCIYPARNLTYLTFLRSIMWIKKERIFYIANCLHRKYQEINLVCSAASKIELTGINQFGLLHMFRKLVSSRGEALWVGMRMDR